jgi:hypothetical protein
MRFLIIAVAVLGLAAGAWYFLIARRDPAQRAINPELFNAYQATAMTAGPDDAIRALQGLQKRDSRNALNHYLLAAALARKRNWTEVARELEAGNKAPECLIYRVNGTPFAPLPNMATLRQLARDCIAAAPGLGVDRGAALLQDVRGMSKRVATAEPRSSLHVLVAMATAAMADSALVRLYASQAASTPAKRARQLQAADQAWAKRAQATAQAELARSDYANPARLQARYGVTNEEMRALSAGGKPAAATQAKVDAMGRDFAAADRALADRMLQGMPD